MPKLTSFLSDFPFFENERFFISHVEEFLLEQYLVKPLLVFSIQNKISQIDLKKCRTVLNKTDRSKCYDSKIVNDLIVNNTNLKSLPCLSVKVADCFYYYLNLGLKRNQFYFAIFTAEVDIALTDLIALSKFSASHFRIIERFEDLYKTQELIYIDDVTGLYNQRKLHKDMAHLAEKFAIEKDPFCVLFIDIDYFKKVNDTYGHLVGTKLLESVAADIKSLLRDSDISYRYGGDEFVIILVDSDALAGKLVGERILNMIKGREYEAEVKNETKKLKLSVSIGVAEFPTDAVTASEILSIADRMMYEAKESGRGLVFNTQDVFKSSLGKAIDQKKKP